MNYLIAGLLGAIVVGLYFILAVLRAILDEIRRGENEEYGEERRLEA